MLSAVLACKLVVAKSLHWRCHRAISYLKGPIGANRPLTLGSLTSVGTDCRRGVQLVLRRYKAIFERKIGAWY